MRPRILLIDQRQSDHSTELLPILEKKSTVKLCTDVKAISRAVQTFRPHLAWFEFDYPTVKGLSAIRTTKALYPRIPIIMVTEHSSESLVLWALRARVWDYLISPVDEDECLARIGSLSHLWAPVPLERRRTPRPIFMCRDSIPVEARFPSPTVPRELRRVVSYIERHLHEKIRLTVLAGSSGMSPSQLSRNFKKVHGIGFMDYLTKRRIEQAACLLKNPSATVTDVCYTVGFSDISHFTRTFRRIMGLTPSHHKARSAASNGWPATVDCSKRNQPILQTESTSARPSPSAEEDGGCAHA
jgi:AraC-like DNA-binding protein